MATRKHVRHKSTPVHSRDAKNDRSSPAYTIGHSKEDEQIADARSKALKKNRRSLERDPFSTYRKRILKRPQRASDTLQPYGRLKLEVHRASHLQPSDITGLCDSYPKVYLNDMWEDGGPENFKLQTRDPEWNFECSIDVWSPLGILMVKVKDRDLISWSDNIGFVEFRIADLKPNEEVSGWFELRMMGKLDGLADARLKEHMSKLDGPNMPRPGDATTAAQGSSQAAERSLKASSVARHPKNGNADPNAPLPTASEHDNEVIVPADTWNSCCGAKAKENVSALKEFYLGNDKRANAGWIHMTMKLDTRRKRRRKGEEEWYTDPWDEWYAFGLPTPEPQYYESLEGLDSLDLSSLYLDVMAIKSAVWDKFLVPWAVIAYYILSWESKLLSASVVAWWWFVCYFPFLFPASLPLFAAYFLFIFRRPQWLADMLKHEKTLPLSIEGFKKVCEWHESERVAIWLGRFIEYKMNSKVMNDDELRSFAALSFRNGKPVWKLRTLEGLQSELQSQTFVKKKMWCTRMASSTLGDIPRQETDESMASEEPEEIPGWTKIPPMFVPDSLQYVLRQYQGKFNQARVQVCHVMDWASQLLEHDGVGKRMALVTYVNLILASLFLAAIAVCVKMLEDKYEEKMHTAKWIFFTAAGTLGIVFGMPKTQVTRTTLKAESYYREYAARRHKDLAKRWAFFLPDEEHRRPLLASMAPIHPGQGPK